MGGGQLVADTRLSLTLGDIRAQPGRFGASCHDRSDALEFACPKRQVASLIEENSCAGITPTRTQPA